MVETLISVDEYLHTMYHPDQDYVDGELQERNMAEKTHSIVQGEFLFYLRSRQREWKVFVFPEQRIQVKPTRFRIPDICVCVGRRPGEEIFQTPPFLCIEILSPGDRMDRVRERIDDFLTFGVPYVWVVDPRTRRGLVYTRDEIREPKDGVLGTENPSLIVPLAEIFAALDAQ
jgi:Uma2 family endonuclease